MGVSRLIVLATLGLGSLLLYLAMAAVGAQVLAALWAQRPSPGALVTVFVGTALVLGLLSYWTGTARLRQSLDARPLTRTAVPGIYRRLDRLTERMNAGKPLALARALRKIERASTADIGPLTPLYVHGTEDNPLSRLLSTHPPMDDRIDRLRQRPPAQRRP